MPALSIGLDSVGQTVDRCFGVRMRFGVFHTGSCLMAALIPSLGASYSALMLFDPPFCSAGRGIAHWVLNSICSRAAARTRNLVGQFRNEQEFLDHVGQKSRRF